MARDSQGFTLAAMGFAVLLQLTLGCASARPTTTAPPAPAPAAEIYAAVIGSHFQPKPDRQLYISSTLRLPSDRLGSFEHPLRPALVEASSIVMSLPDNLPVPLSYTILSARELETAERERRPDDGLLPGHPDADELVSFSAIGFDPSGHRALVYVQWHCGRECGGGAYYELEYTGDYWRTVKYFPLFYS